MIYALTPEMAVGLELKPTAWFDADFEVDWPETIKLPRTYLITDGEGSYCFIQPQTEKTIEGHIYLDPANRGAKGKPIIADMLAWIDQNVEHGLLFAKTYERSTKLFLRRIGFTEMQSMGDLTFFFRMRPSG